VTFFFDCPKPRPVTLNLTLRCAKSASGLSGAVHLSDEVHFPIEISAFQGSTAVQKSHRPAKGRFLGIVSRIEAFVLKPLLASHRRLDAFSPLHHQWTA